MNNDIGYVKAVPRPLYSIRLQIFKNICNILNILGSCYCLMEIITLWKTEA